MLRNALCRQGGACRIGWQCLAQNVHCQQLATPTFQGKLASTRLQSAPRCKSIAARFQSTEAAPSLDVQASSGNDAAPIALTAAELCVEAQLARLSCACYLPWLELKERVRGEGFDFVAGGDTFFTRWYLARGPLQQVDTAAPQDAHTTQHKVAEPVTCLVVRGVMWRSAEVNSFRTWQQISKSRPAPFLQGWLGGMATGGTLQVHEGIAEMAHELHTAVQQHIGTATGDIVLTGHSLGGSLAKVVGAQGIVAGTCDAQRTRISTFGSPPAFTSSCGSHSSAILAHMGIAPHRIRNWVLDYDPVPRAMLSADPYYQFAMRSSAVRNVLKLGEWAWGAGSVPSATRFLFRSVGDTFLLRAGHAATEHVPIPEDTIEEVLQLPLDELWERPTLVLQTMLDHTCTSYSHDVGTAARLQLRRERNSATRRHDSGAAPVQSKAHGRETLAQQDAPGATVVERAASHAVAVH